MSRAAYLAAAGRTEASSEELGKLVLAAAQEAYTRKPYVTGPPEPRAARTARTGEPRWGDRPVERRYPKCSTAT